MQKSTPPQASSADIGFALVVLVSYLAALSSWQNTTLLELATIILAGIGYISVGIYGYAHASRYGAFWVRVMYFVIQIPLGGIIVLLGKGNGFNALVLLPLAAQSVILLQGVYFYVANAAILGTFILTVSIFNPGWSSAITGIQLFLAGQVFVIIFTRMAVKEEQDRKVIEKLANDLTIANQNLRQYALQVEELTLNKERNRLAREIHDGLGHYLTTIHMHLQAASALSRQDHNEKLLQTINTARDLTQEALDDVRSSVAALRAPPGEGLPLPQRLEGLLPNLGPDIQTHFSLTGEARELSSEADWTLYRAAQEGLQNTSKHAHASHLWLALDYSQPHQVQLAITDDGIGTEVIEPGFGLLGLQERIKLMDGNLSITSAPMKGFKVVITLPE
ncbi:MAG: sensor histidine kinase [Chloroflexi bacterium]|nr:sensor histidine kinase [Chloroflexota bacterium]